MKIISTKEERERLIELLVSKKSNLLPLDRKDCNYLKEAQTVIEYTFRTNLMRDENRVTELIKIVNEADLSNIKEYQCLYFIIRSSSIHGITMDEMSDICKVLEKICNDETSILWTSSHDNSLTCNLELVIVASK
ncbi:hypothetical protein [Odoribacter sp. N15.MGS-14]|uniref:hypothetical protein n=1 Tax=Odoribacter sp. N15.MGS-14 TaxID=1637502 RepID=UPI000623361C|nr:hypothetical protein [Odoribacter sp. N15.MGS-14]